MTASGTARVLATLLTGVRVTAVALAAAILVAVVRGEPLNLQGLLSVPREVENVISASVTRSDGHDAAVPTTKAQVRRRLQQVLSHHAVLTVRFMRSTVSEDAGFVEAANAVVVRNTEDLQHALRHALGDQDATAFAEGWSAYAPLLFDYATALRDGDAAAREQARAGLRAYIDEQAALGADVTDGRLGADVTANTLRMQIDLLLYQIDTYARGEYDQAYELEREVYAHIHPYASALAAAATGGGDGASRAGAGAQARTDMVVLLGEHSELTIDALRAGVAGKQEFAAAGKALHANTQQLADTVDALVGSREARRFNRLMTKRTDLLVRYAVAVAESDPSARRKLRKRLRTVAERLGDTVARATDGRVEPMAAAEAIGSHDLLQLDQIEAYAAGDHGGAHDLAYAAHRQMHDAAHLLAKAFVATANAGAPKGGANTGAGGTATRTT